MGWGDEGREHGGVGDEGRGHGGVGWGMKGGNMVGSTLFLPPPPAPTASSMLSISPKHLREISDPILALLTQLHKLVYLTQLPPPPTPSARWTLVQSYKRWLFQHGSDGAQLKAELHRLVGGGSGGVVGEEQGEGLFSSRMVQCALQEMPQEQLLGGGYVNPDEKAATVTYETLQRIIESLVIEHGYYQETTPT